MLWWNESLTTGIEKVDMQHKNIFSKLERILDYSPSVSKEEIEDLLGFLIAYVGEHFSYEENIMLRKQYDQFEQHREEHTYLMVQVHQLHKRFKTEGISDEWLDDFKFLFVEWFANHIHRGDQDLAHFLKEKNPLSL